MIKVQSQEIVNEWPVYTVYTEHNSDLLISLWLRNNKIIINN